MTLTLELFRIGFFLFTFIPTNFSQMSKNYLSQCTILYKEKQRLSLKAASIVMPLKLKQEYPVLSCQLCTNRGLSIYNCDVTFFETLEIATMTDPAILRELLAVY